MSLDKKIAGLEARNAELQADLEELSRERDALCAELARFRDFASCASEWRWEMDSSLRFTSVTEQCEKETGIPIQSLIGKRRDEAGDFEKDDPALAGHLADLAARRPFREFEYKCTGEDGVVRHFSTSGNPVFGPDGNFLGYRGIARDIGETKLAEQRALEATELFQAVMDAAPLNIAFKDREGRYLQVNRVWEIGQGLSNAEVVGKKTEEIFPEPYADLISARDHQVISEGRVLQSEEQIAHSDGTLHDYLAVRFPITHASGAIRGHGLIGLDISLRKATEQALSESELQLRSITENLPVLIARFDSEERYVFASRIAEQWYARPMSEIVGRRIPEIFGPGAYEAVKPHIAEVIAGETSHFEGAITYPDGKAREMEVTFVPDVAADGSVQGWFALALDITDRKRAERALEGTESQLRTVTDNLPALIIRYDRDQRITLVNKTAEQWYARPASEILGRTIAQILGQANATRFAPHLDCALEGQNVSFEVSLSFPDGVDRHTEVNYVPDRAPDGTVQGVFALVLDGTARMTAERARRESEARMAAIIENSPAPIYLKDLEGRFLLASRDFARLFEFESDDVIGKTSRDIHSPEVAEEYIAQDRAAIEGRSAASREVLMQLKDGTQRTVVVTKFPVFDADGEMIAVGGVNMDITELKRLEGVLLRKERLAAMGHLTGTVAHELRNPLGAVTMSLAVIRKKCEEAGLDLGRALDRAARGIHRSDRIVTDLLDFARARGLEPVPGRPDSWLADLLDEHGIPDGITLVRQLSAGEETVEFDAEWLRRAVINVLDNACQALNGGSDCPDKVAGPTVTVSTGAADGRFAVTIADNGPGIPPDILPQVTEPLVSTKNFGTGLGLPTVKRIMEDHGGGLEIKSQPCQGARVTLWLPLNSARA